MCEQLVRQIWTLLNSNFMAAIAGALSAYFFQRWLSQNEQRKKEHAEMCELMISLFYMKNTLLHIASELGEERALEILQFESYQPPEDTPRVSFIVKHKDFSNVLMDVHIATHGYAAAQKSIGNFNEIIRQHLTRLKTLDDDQNPSVAKFGLPTDVGLFLANERNDIRKQVSEVLTLLDTAIRRCHAACDKLFPGLGTPMFSPTKDISEKTA